MIHFVTFKWRSDFYRVKYEAFHVNVLEAMVRRYWRGEMRFVCVTDDPDGVEGETFPLWKDCAQLVNASGRHLPSCYRRLKLFDPEQQSALGIMPGERIVLLDIDMAIASDLNPLFDRAEDFVGWALKGTNHPRVFNGSMWMLRAGAEAHVWREFDPDASPKEARQAGFLGSDQSWMSYRLQGRSGWTQEDGVYSYATELKRFDAPPDNARVILFNGFNEKPWMPTVKPWVANYYRGGAAGRVLILGYAETVWEETEKALDKFDFDAVIASPEAAEHWPGPIFAVAQDDTQAEMLARAAGFDEIVFCGRSEAVQKAA